MKGKVKKECQTVQDKLGTYLRGKLSRGETSKVQGHLRICGDCKEALALEEVFLNAVGAYPCLAVPEDFADKVMKVWAAESTIAIPIEDWNIYNPWDLPQVVGRIFATNLRWATYHFRFGLTFGHQMIEATLLNIRAQLRFEIQCIYQIIIESLRVSLSGIYPLTEE